MRYVMRQKLLSLADNFTIKDENEHDAFLVKGKVFSFGDKVVATVSKKWFSWTDTYGIEIAEGEDPVLVLASAVVVDMVCHDQNKRR